MRNSNSVKRVFPKYANRNPTSNVKIPDTYQTTTLTPPMRIPAATTPSYFPSLIKC
jgi:hypothetical protein